MNTITIDSQVIDIDLAIANINRILNAKVAKLGIEIRTVDRKINECHRLAFGNSDESPQVTAIGDFCYYGGIDGLEIKVGDYVLPLDEAPDDVKRELSNVANCMGPDAFSDYLDSYEHDEDTFAELPQDEQDHITDMFKSGNVDITNEYFCDGLNDGQYPEFEFWFKMIKQQALGKDILNSINVIKSGFWDSLFNCCDCSFETLLGERTGDMHDFKVIAICDDLLVVQNAVDDFEFYTGNDDEAELWTSCKTLDKAMELLNRYKFAA